ncbi:MAG: hypothetical protein ACM3ZQ_05605 [Bacillota bacterium]
MSRNNRRRNSRVASAFDRIDGRNFRRDFFDETTAHFLRQLSPGIGVVLQYDCMPPAFGTFQGFQNGNVILSNYNGFPGLVRINPERVNAVSPFSGFGGGFGGGFTPYNGFYPFFGFGGFGAF